MENTENNTQNQESSTVKMPEETKELEKIESSKVVSSDTEQVSEPIIPKKKTVSDIDPSQKARITRAINDFKTEAQELLKEIKKSHANILESSTESIAVKNKIDIAFTSIEEKLKTAGEQNSEILRIHTEIFKPTEEKDSVENNIKKAEKAILEVSESVQTKKKEFEEYYTKIFGSKDTNGNETPGLKQEIEKNKISLEELHKKETEKFKSLFGKIEGLLPGATTAGLAMAFANQKKDYRWPNVAWSSIFVITMIAMALFGISTLKDITDAAKESSLSISLVFSTILSRTPFFIAAIWLGIFASKQQSQNKRLEQEYAHKENASKSYEGFKRQIDSLEQSDEHKELSLKLLENIVDSIGYNPSATLDNEYHREEPPFLDKALNLITDSEKTDLK